MRPLATAAITTGSVTALALAFLAGTTVGRTPDAGGTPHGTPVRLVNADLALASSCNELRDWYVDRALDLVTAYGWSGGGIVAYEMAEDSATLKAPAPAPVTGGVPTVDRSTSGDSGTNVQEAGVDEPDVVKTDGRLLVRVQDDAVLVYDVTGSEPVLLSTTPLADLDDPQLLLSGTRLVVLGTDTDRHDGWPTTDRMVPQFASDTPGTRLLVLDLTDPAAPETVHEATYDAALDAARLHGSVVRLTLSSGLPALDFRMPDGDLDERSALAYNRKLVAATTLDDWLPQVTTYDGDEPATEDLLSCDDVALPDDDAGLGTLSVVGFDVADPATLDTSAVATDTTIAYESADRLVVAASAGWGWGCWECAVPQSGGMDGTTRLYSFALDGTSATYVASGRVDGAIRDRWSMDESAGVLRVAVGPTQATGDFNSVITLREEGSSLVETGRVDKLGVGEEIKSVRWFDDLALVVTFRQTDPLYAIDLTHADGPRLMGALKIPGFSQYLHPLGAWRMIGVGQSADAETGITSGAQAALFDVRDLTDPRRLDTVEYAPETEALAGSDPRQFTWLPERRTALTVVAKGWEGRTGWVSVLTLDDGRLRNRMVEVEYGDDVAQVRTVPLPDGRVVLVTGDAVDFFDL